VELSVAKRGGSVEILYLLRKIFRRQAIEASIHPPDFWRLFIFLNNPPAMIIEQPYLYKIDELKTLSITKENTSKKNGNINVWAICDIVLESFLGTSLSSITRNCRFVKENEVCLKAM